MNEAKSPLILAVDDDQVTLRLIERILSDSGYDVATANSGSNAFLTLTKAKPNLILLDVMMPEMTGYEICSRLQENEETAFIPVIFVTALGDEEDKAKAFAVGGVDYLEKPIRKDTLLKTISKHLQTKSLWNNFKKEKHSWDIAQPLNFTQFKDFLGKQLNLSPDKKEKVSRVKVSEIYSATDYFGITIQELTQYIAEFSGLNYLPAVNPESIQLGMLPTPFCQKNNVIPTIDESGTNLFVISNPFDWELLDLLKSSFKLHSYKLALSNPDIISSCFSEDILRKEKTQPIRDQQGLEKIILESAASPSESEIAKHPIVAIANSLFHSAVAERASDIHIEPKEEKTIVRFRIDGDMKEAFSIKNKTGIMLISRLKVLANMDIAEKRKPLDGALSAIIDNKTYNIRLATTPTIHGESLVMRVLNAYTKPKDLKELGMTEEQASTLIDLTKRTQGLVLIVGPTGSGKTTTIYSFLNMIDYINRSIVSVEDPVEYRIPFVRQEQVSEKGKANFEALLKSVVRQDPDVLFLGEIRDNYSATTAMNFASTGHLSITTMHTSNATSAIFRLERLGISRGIMADSIIGIVAQKLLKKLCPHCKEIIPVSEEEKMLMFFTNEILQKVARPVGCLKCNDTGYYGREGIFETLNFDADIIEMIRSNIPVSEIRSFARKRGDYLIGDHTLEKVKKFISTPEDAYKYVLVEDVDFRKPAPKIAAPKAQPGEIKREGKKHVLVVEDDVDTRILINRILENSGYRTTLAEDGIDALLHMGKSEYDLILSDVEMPNLDGFKLLEMKNQKGIETPVIFLTSKAGHEDEEKGYELGAIDYLKKPVKKEMLLLRVKKVIEKQK